MKMERIAIIGANEFQNPLILKAKEMGYETHVFAWEAGDIGERTADCFHPISIVERDLILDECRRCGIKAAVSIGSDLAVLTVNYIQRALGNPANSELCDRVATNKYYMREAFRKADIPVPFFSAVHQDCIPSDFASLPFPLIVKPVDRSGSRAINRVDSPDYLQDAINEACAASFEKKAILEEFIVGDEYSCECISFNGCHRVLALTKKHTSGAPHFIERGHDEPSGIPESIVPRIEEMVFAGLDSLGVRFGASHTEFILTANSSPRIVEIGARMGGDFIGSDLVQLSTGYDYLRMVIDIAFGRPPCFDRVPHAESAHVRFAFTRKEYDQLGARFNTESGFVRQRRTAKDGDLGAEVLDSSTRYGYAIYSKS